MHATTKARHDEQSLSFLCSRLTLTGEESLLFVLMGIDGLPGPPLSKSLCLCFCGAIFCLYERGGVGSLGISSFENIFSLVPPKFD
jgi:hypothetical protein